jgi:hypothetical protein
MHAIVLSVDEKSQIQAWRKAWGRGISRHNNFYLAHWGVEDFLTKFAKKRRAVTHENERDGSARPIRMLRFVYRVFWLCQSRMGIDPIDSILLGSKFFEIVHGPIRPRYPHAPNLALSPSCTGDN